MIVLETERLYLREWVPDDWLRFKPLVVDPRVVKYIQQGEPWTDERIELRVQQYIQYGRTRGWHLWAVIHRGDARLIGFCGFSDGFPPDVEIGWRLLPDYWGQGLATEAATATLEYGFHTWHFPRVIAVAQAPNRASIRVMEKIGMTFDGSFDQNGIQLVRYVAENPRPATGGAGSLTCRLATADDADLLARMNQQLIEDEGSRNPMSLSELQARMSKWLDGPWQAAVVELGGEPVGYLLFLRRSDECQPADETACVRQFFVAREHRSRGIGRQAFEMAAQAHFPDVSSVVLDVLETNPQARRFWESIGFKPYCTTMRFSTVTSGA